MIRQAAAVVGLAAMLLTPATAFADGAGEAGAVTTITGQGGSGWEMICHILPADGGETIRILDPSRSTFSGRDVRRASCEFKNHGRAPLVVSISAPEAQCPLKSDNADQCTQTFAAGAPGSFELRMKRDR